MQKVLTEFRALVDGSKYNGTHLSIGKKIRYSISLAILVAAINLIFLLITYSFFLHFELHIPENLFQNRLRNSGLISYILITVLIAPVTEEIGFRMILRYSALSISMLGAYIVFVIILKRDLYNMYLEDALWKTIVMIACYFLLYFTINRSSINLILQRFCLKNSLIIFFISSLAFSIVHLKNFSEFSLIMVIFLFPYIFIAIVLGLVRLVFGLSYATLVHSIYNLIPTSIYLYLNT